ncbi:MAG: hypothetical protein GY795_19040 [Desulfobacterales bacterium]|nr:hypothetical protein [Desulfobacterales bacterium]
MSSIILLFSVTGAKTVEIMGTGAGKRRFTVVLCIAADGRVIDVMIIFKGLKKIPTVPNLPDNIVLAVAKGGSMNFPTMKRWIEKVNGWGLLNI